MKMFGYHLIENVEELLGLEEINGRDALVVGCEVPVDGLPDFGHGGVKIPMVDSD